MTDKKETGATGSHRAAARVADIAALTADIRRLLTEMRDAARGGGGPLPKDLADKVAQLHAAHLKVVASEDMFHAKFGKTDADDAIDFDAVRADIGRQLDRIRAAIVTSGLSDPAD